MEQLIKYKNNNNNNIYCVKCGKHLKNDVVKDILGNLFCDNECKREFWLELQQDNDDVFREIYGKDY